MSKYTTELRFICEQQAGFDESQGGANVEAVIAVSRTKIFNFDYPYYNEEQKSRWERLFLLYYYTQEICEETLGLWKIRLKARLNKVMPRYIQLYALEDKSKEIDFFRDVDYTKEHTGTNDETGANNLVANTNFDGEDWNMYSDTPQGSLSGVSDERYLTNATHATNSGGTGSEQSVTSENHKDTNFSERVYGKYPGKSYSEIMAEYQKAVYNIDEQLLKEFSDLFMWLW